MIYSSLLLYLSLPCTFQHFFSLICNVINWSLGQTTIYSNFTKLHVTTHCLPSVYRAERATVAQRGNYNLHCNSGMIILPSV